MRKNFLFWGLVIFSMLAMSCDVKTNFPTESTGNFFVHNESSSGKTITRIAVTDSPSIFGAPGTHYNERANIPPGSKSQKISIRLEYSDYVSSWNKFRVTVTLNDNSTAYVDIIIYEDIELNLRYDGAKLVQN